MKSDVEIEAYLPEGRNCVKDELVVSFRWRGKDESLDSVPFIPIRLKNFSYDGYNYYEPVHNATFNDQIKWLTDYTKKGETDIIRMIESTIHAELVLCPVVKFNLKQYIAGNNSELKNFANNNNLSIKELEIIEYLIKDQIKDMNVYVFMRDEGCSVRIK